MSAPATPTEAPTLLPCPFCGSSNVETVSLPMWTITCRSCLAGSCLRETVEGAVEAWNRRHQPTGRVHDPRNDLECAGVCGYCGSGQNCPYVATLDSGRLFRRRAAVPSHDPEGAR